MKTLATILLALCVCGGTTAYSQITIDAATCRTLIHRLDTLNYLRAGNAQLQQMLANRDSMVQCDSLLIVGKDTIIAAQVRRERDSQDRLAKSMQAEYKWRGISLGLGAATFLSIGAAIVIAVLK